MKTNTETLSLDTTQEVVVSTSETNSKPTHLNLNNLGSVKCVIEGVHPSTKNRRGYCDCGSCSACRATLANYVSVYFDIHSYNSAVGSDCECIRFPSVESFTEFQKFITSLDTSKLFKQPEQGVAV